MVAELGALWILVILSEPEFTLALASGKEIGDVIKLLKASTLAADYSFLPPSAFLIIGGCPYNKSHPDLFHHQGLGF